MFNHRRTSALNAQALPLPLLIAEYKIFLPRIQEHAVDMAVVRLAARHFLHGSKLQAFPSPGFREKGRDIRGLVLERFTTRCGVAR